ncbi:zinc finger, C2H2-type domain containing protein [Rhodotorula toruloides]|uniref:Zinc finger, C2H2-type domain containing protein n=1 Tax=Rhodotorula toruloides TaxID=5286 RepID=A0A511KHH2_RHOTO|nr:zinc finger, C2H2-type domain containing protein [Rhodotorula toruloides]
MSPAPAGQPQGAGPPKKKEGKVAACRYCDMTFRKLEHAQRHERTHTNDRPYTCDKCGKTFARQDTLHRHGRLHLRDNDDGPTAKGGRKRRASNASATAKPPTPPKTGSDSSSSSSGRAGSSEQATASTSFSTMGAGDILVGGPSSSHPSQGFVPPRPSTCTSSSTFPGLGLTMGLPVAPPSFHAFGTTNSNSAQQQPEFPHFPSINPAVIPLPRRFSDAGYGASLATDQYGRSAPSASAAFPGTGAPAQGGDASQARGRRGEADASGAGCPPRPSLRPRALTLAGLPESLGCFSLANSPVASNAGDLMSEDDESSTASSDEDGNGDDTMDSDRKVSSATSTAASDLDGVECDVASPVAPESHYPSPAFSSYSPSSLHADHLTDLHAILENDPVPSHAFQRPHLHSHPSSPPTAQPDFDFESFAASIEGPGPANLGRRMPSNIPTTLEELLSNTANDLSAPVPIALTAEEKAKATQQQSQVDVERYPTPPSGTLSSSALALHPEPSSHSFEASASYDLAAHINSIISSADADQQARDRAATAAMYSSGFGVSPGAAQVGVNYGLPTPMPTYSQPGPAPATSHAERPLTSATTSSLSLPVLSNPLGAGSPASIPRDSSFFAAALSATYATTYPSLSLPVAGFDLPNSTSLKSNMPTTFDLKAAMNGLSPISMSAPADSSVSHFDRLAKAWEQRQRAAALLSAQEGARKQPQINLRSPFAHPARSTPAFYIPASGGPASPPSSASSSTSASATAGDSKASSALAALSAPSKSLW